jgi:hypothetical protein
MGLPKTSDKPKAMANNTLPDRAAKKATNLIRDSKQAIVVGLIPILGLIFILRLVQWYLLRKEHPSLATDNAELATDFRSALHRLWFAVLFWPILVLVLIVYFSLT